MRLIKMTELGLKPQTDKLKHISLLAAAAAAAAAPLTSLWDPKKREVEKHPLCPLIFPRPSPSPFILEVCTMENQE